MPNSVATPRNPASDADFTLRSPRTTGGEARPMRRAQVPLSRERGVPLRDRFAAALLLLPAAPVMAVVWCLVRLTSSGPGVYSQSRSGHRGRPFRIHKFRSMTHNCEKHTGAVWAKKNDPRVTWLGAILRKTHLDELPQLFNVLRGEMALVGPRPERPEIVDMLVREIPDYARRMEVPPGVTGLAQIHAEPDQTLDDVRRKLRYDLQYVAAATVWLDTKIVAITALKMVGLNRPWLRGWLFGRIVTRGPRTDAGSPDVPGQPWITV
jgi:lipopolysaccharide/colanic/teichoic acid biosynthesis glycosyltransferase